MSVDLLAERACTESNASVTSPHLDKFGEPLLPIVSLYDQQHSDYSSKTLLYVRHPLLLRVRLDFYQNHLDNWERRVSVDPHRGQKHTHVLLFPSTAKAHTHPYRPVIIFTVYRAIGPCRTVLDNIYVCTRYTCAWHQSSAKAQTHPGNRV